MGKRANSFREAAKRYETWLSSYCELDRKALARKEEKMGKSAFAFLRATFFRWPHYLGAVEPRILKVPAILCVGDIHLENYGTWRDAEGRLVWGINDFDEAAGLPFTSDLTRLAASRRGRDRERILAGIEWAAPAIRSRRSASGAAGPGDRERRGGQGRVGEDPR